MRWATLLVLGGCTGFLFFASGCGGNRVAPSLDETATEKVKAMKNLADELAKDPEGPGAQAALEQFRIMELDAAKHPKQAQELVEIYRQRIQGKYRGTVASELQNEMSPYLIKKK